MKILISTIIVFTSCSYFAYFTIRRVDHNVIFDGEIQFLIGMAVLAIFLIALYKGIQSYRLHKRWNVFIPVICGVVIGLALLTRLYFLGLRDRSPVKLYCVTKVVDFNGASFDFREDGTYKFTSWSMGADYYRGHYTITDSIITLDTSTIERVIESNRLLIRQDGDKQEDGSIDTSIYQIDSTGQIITHSIQFRVHSNIVSNR